MTHHDQPAFRPYSLAAFGGLILCSCAFVWPDEAQAACSQTGSLVECSGNDFDGFRSTDSLTINVRPNAFIQNVISNETLGNCPLSLPAIEAGPSTTVRNEGTISTGGVCGIGILVDENSSVVNLGAIRTMDFAAYGILAGQGGTVRNGGLITTILQSSGGILADGNMAIVNDKNGRIVTSGAGSSGIETGRNSSITNDGQIITTGDAAIGIDAGRNSTVTNSGSIQTSANNSIGLRIAGGNAINAGEIRSVLTGPAFALVPTVGVSVIGETAGFTNAAGATILATHVGVRLSGSQGAEFANSGQIDVLPAVQYDGTQSASSAAVLLSGTARVDMSNSGAIRAHGGLPAVLSLGASVELRNTGAISGDVILSDGNDIITFGPSSSFSGRMDFGAGDDTLILQNGGVFDLPVANLERLTKIGPEALLVARDIAVSQQINVLGGGGLIIARGTRVSAALTDNIGTLRGMGTIAGALNNSGIVAPGTATEKGTLTITGPFRQFPGGTLALRISPDGTSDRLIVGGPATLAGTLLLTLDTTQGAQFRDGQRFDIITPSGSVLASTGEFTVAAPGMTFVSAHVAKTSAGGFAAEIDRLSFDTVGVTDSQKSAGRMLDRLLDVQPPVLSSTYRQLDAATPAAATAILAGLAPESPTGVQVLGLSALDRFADTLRRRTAALDRKRFAWAQGVVSSGRSRNSTSPADYDLKGAAAGTEMDYGSASFGIAAAQFSGDFERGSEHAAYDAAILGLVAHLDRPAFALDAAFAYGAGESEMGRLSQVSRTSGLAVIKPDIELWSASLDGSMRRSVGPITLTPHVGVAYHEAGIEPTEGNQVLAVHTEQAKVQSMRGRIGAAIDGTGGSVRPYGDLSISVEFLDRAPRVGANIAEVANSTFDLVGDGRRRIALEAEAGVSVAFSPSSEAYLVGKITANDLVAGRSLSAGMRFHW